MFKPKFTITNSIENTLTTIERARGFLEAATLSDEAFGKQAIEQDVLARQYHLSDKQKLASEYIVKHGGISIRQFEEICPDVTRRTLQRELKELIDKNILIKTGATSNLIYEMQVKSKQD